MDDNKRNDKICLNIIHMIDLIDLLKKSINKPYYKCERELYRFLPIVRGKRYYYYTKESFIGKKDYDEHYFYEDTIYPILDSLCKDDYLIIWIKEVYFEDIWEY